MTTALQVDHLPVYAVRRQELARACVALALFSIVLLFARSQSVSVEVPADKAAIKAQMEELSGWPVDTVRFYDIDAVDLAGIQDQMKSRGPMEDGKRFAGSMNWHISGKWPGLPDGSCGTTSATARIRFEVTLPRLTSHVAPEVAESWTRYMSALVRHEAGHVSIAGAHLPTVLEAVRRSGCAEANAAANRELDEIRRQQRRYDADTNHGFREGVSLD